MNKLNSYQRLKQKYDKKVTELTDDIITLIKEKDYMKFQIVKAKWKFILDIEEIIWMGDPTKL
jgi:hypothetical protein